MDQLTTNANSGQQNSNETHHGGYWAICPAEVLDCDSIEPAALKLYLQITRLTIKQGYCWAGNDYIAQQMKISVRTLQRYLNQLLDHGFIEISYPNAPDQRERHICTVNSNNLQPRHGCRGTMTPVTRYHDTGDAVLYKEEERQMKKDNRRGTRASITQPPPSVSCEIMETKTLRFGKYVEVTLEEWADLKADFTLEVLKKAAIAVDGWYEGRRPQGGYGLAIRRWIERPKEWALAKVGASHRNSPRGSRSS